MEMLKKSGDCNIYKKRSGRYAVRKNGKWVNGEEKIKILLSEKLIKIDPPKKKEEPAPEQAAD